METIKSKEEISDLFASGRRIHTSYLTFIVLPKQHDRNGRVAFIAGKKLGNAVWRNAAKRRMREICRNLNGPWSEFDVVMLAKRRVTEAPFAEMLQKCEKSLAKEGVLDGEAPRI